MPTTDTPTTSGTNRTGVRPRIGLLSPHKIDPPPLRADSPIPQKQTSPMPPSTETPLWEILAMIGDFSDKTWPLDPMDERGLIRVIDWISQHYADQPPAAVVRRLNYVCPKRDNPAIRDRLRIRGLLLSE